MANVQIMELLPEVAQICRRAPTGTLIRAYNRAVRDWMRQTRWYRSNLPGALESGVRVYSCGQDNLMEVCGLHAASITPLSGNTNPWPLQVSNDTGMWNPSQVPGSPVRYAYIPEGQVGFDPIPNGAYQVLLTLVLTMRRRAVVVPEEVLTKWEYCFQAGALEYLLSIPEQPWTDLAESKRQGLVYRAGINNAKADEQRGYNAGTVFMKRRPFVTGR